MPAFLRRVVLIAATTCLVALASTSSASAVRSIGLSPAGEEIALVWDGPIRFNTPLDPPGINEWFRCGGELYGTLNGSIPMTPGASVGTITRATFYSCNTNWGFVPQVTTTGLPWNIAYRDFAGPLPRRGRGDDSPRTLDLAIEDFQIHDTLFECSHAGDLALRIHFGGSPSVAGPVELQREWLHGIDDGVNDCTTPGPALLLLGYYRFSPDVTLVPAR